MATEKDNICNLPLVALIEIHRSDETGYKYLSFISWDDDSGIGIKKGRWTEKRISESDLTKIVKVLKGDVMNEDCGEVYGCFSWKNPYGKIVIDGHVFVVRLKNVESIVIHDEGERTVFGVVKEPKDIVQRSFNFVEVIYCFEKSI